MTMFVIVRKFYRDARAMESGTPYKTHTHTMRPMSLHDCRVVIPKLATPANAIDTPQPIIN